MKKLFLLFFAMLLALYFAQAQCGTETIEAKDWCDNQYASWKITNPEVGAKYHWYEPTMTDTVDRFYGENKEGTVYYSTTRYADAGNGNNDVTMLYVKEKDNATPFIEFRDTLSPHYIQIQNNEDYYVDFTLETKLFIQSVRVPVHDLQCCGISYKIQLEIAGVGFSPVYKFTRDDASVEDISNNTWLVTVPVNLNVPVGDHKMIVLAKPAAGDGENVKLITFKDNGGVNLKSFTGMGIENAEPHEYVEKYNDDYYTPIFDWNYTSYCEPELTPVSTFTTVACCAPVLGKPMLYSEQNVMVSGVDEVDLTVAGESVSNYYSWSRDGVEIANATGVGSTSITTQEAGVYCVKEVQEEQQVENKSCYAKSCIELGERTVFTQVNETNSMLCMGEAVEVEAKGDFVNGYWSPASLVKNPAHRITEFLAYENGSQTLSFIADKNLVVNGAFEEGNQGFTSEHNYTEQVNMAGPGSYSVNTEVNADYEVPPAWSSWTTGCKDHSSGQGNYMFVDASTQKNTSFWAQEVDVKPNTAYEISYWVMNFNEDLEPFTEEESVANIQLSIDGVDYGEAQLVDSNLCVWKKVTIDWNSGGLDEVSFDLRSVNLRTSGNQFAIDDIALVKKETAPQTSVLAFNVEDCFEIETEVSACIGDSVKLSANSNADFIYWEDEVGVKLGEGDSLWVGSKLTVTYTAIGKFTKINLLDNGDFEQGYTGFGTGGMEYRSSHIGSGQVGIVTVPSKETMCGGFCDVGLTDHTSGEGNMLFVDMPSSDTDILTFDFNASSGKEYYLSAWFANAFNNEKYGEEEFKTPNVRMSIDGIELGTMDLIQDNSWNELFVNWVAPSTGNYTLVINAMGDNTLSGLAANDFVIDDVGVYEYFDFTRESIITVDPCNITSTGLTGEQSFKVFPNPSTDVLNIQGVNEKAIWEIISLDGISVLKGSGSEVNVEILEQGMYMLKSKGLHTTFLKE